MRNNANKYYYTVVDKNGKLMFEPRNDIEFYVSNSDVSDPITENNYNICHNLLPARDKKTGLWGYIDVNGEWKISPQYTNAYAFSADGYATVSNCIIIDTTGKVVLAPKGWTNKNVTSLSGEYRYVETVSGMTSTYTFTFYEDGTAKWTSHSTFSYSGSAKYTIEGGIITLTIGYTLGAVSGVDSSGDYAFLNNDDYIIINGVTWKKVVQDGV